MNKFVKKPIEVEAFLFNDPFEQNFINWKHQSKLFEVLNVYSTDPEGKMFAYSITTLEGEMVLKRGDWIIKGIHGEFYACKPDIFEKTYSPVEE